MHGAMEDGHLVSGRYRLHGPIGRGAMGTVWRARDELLDRQVAVKEVRAGGPASAAENGGIYRRTLREAKAAARLNHPGVVTVFDVVEEDGRPWIVMELVPARSLDRLIAEEGPLRPLEAARVGADLLSALACAHAAGVLHRDVKPGNVLIGPDDRTVLTDFGIATFQDDPALTQAGMVVGTPGFTAPERVRGGSASPASDLWSLGATLFAAVEGRGPFDRPGGAAAITAGVLGEDAPRAPSAGPLAGVIGALLRADPAQRPDTVTAARLLAHAAAEASARPAYPGAFPPAESAPAFARIRDVPELPHEGGRPGRPGQFALAGTAAPGASPTLLSPPAFADGEGLADLAAFANPAALPDQPDVPHPGTPGEQPAFADLIRPGNPAWLPPAAGSGATGPVAAGPAAPAAGGSPGPTAGGSPARPAGGSPATAAGGSPGPAASGSSRPARRPAGRRARLPALATAAVAAVALAAGLVAWSAVPRPAGAAPPPGATGAAAPAGSGPVSARDARQGPAQRARGATDTGAGPRPAASGTPTDSGQHAGTGTSGPASPPAGYRWYELTAASTGTTAGFEIAAPATWIMIRQGPATYLKPPAGQAYIEINLAPFSYLRPLREVTFLQAKALSQAQYPGYRLTGIAAGGFLGAPDATWRFRWQQSGVGRVDVLELLTTVTTAAGTQPYALTLSAPWAGFPVAEAVFLRALATFRPLP